MADLCNACSDWSTVKCQLTIREMSSPTFILCRGQISATFVGKCEHVIIEAINSVLNEQMSFSDLLLSSVRQSAVNYSIANAEV